MPWPYCCITSCPNSRIMRNRLGLEAFSDTETKRTKRPTYFKFPGPVDTISRDKWIEFCDRPEWQPAALDRMCSEHFSNDSFVLMKRLSTTKPGRKPLVKSIWTPNSKLSMNTNSDSVKLISTEETLDAVAKRLQGKREHSIVQHYKILKKGSMPCIFSVKAKQTLLSLSVPMPIPFGLRKVKKLELLARNSLLTTKANKFVPPDKKISTILLNECLICTVCSGYFVNPVTITECLHTFCRSCLVQHFYYRLYCPSCKVEVHPTEPLVHVRCDTLKQDILNRLLPHIEIDEEKREIDFYVKRGLPRPVRKDKHRTAPPPKILTSPKYVNGSSLDLDDGHDSEALAKNFYPKEALVSLEIEYAGSVGTNNISIQPLYKKFVRTLSRATVAQIGAFVRLKLKLPDLKIDIFCDNVLLDDDMTMDFVSDYFYDGDPDAVVQLHYSLSKYGLQVEFHHLFDGPNSPLPASSSPQPSLLSLHSASGRYSPASVHSTSPGLSPLVSVDSPLITPRMSPIASPEMSPQHNSTSYEHSRASSHRASSTENSPERYPEHINGNSQQLSSDLWPEYSPEHVTEDWREHFNENSSDHSTSHWPVPSPEKWPDRSTEHSTGNSIYASVEKSPGHSRLRQSPAFSASPEPRLESPIDDFYMNYEYDDDDDDDEMEESTSPPPN